MEIRLLRADEIECRVGTVNEKGVSLLLYLRAQVGMDILDRTFGPYNWRRSHQAINGDLFCTLEIYDAEKHEWIPKQDVGSCGNIEKAKSLASDSFKRSCFLWGIGRELYSAPFIWIPATDKVSIVKKNDSYYCNTKFKVDYIEYNKEREITGLRICDSNGNMVFEYHKKDSKESKSISKSNIELLRKEMERTKVSWAEIADRYGVSSEDDISPELFIKIIAALKKTKSKAA